MPCCAIGDCGRGIEQKHEAGMVFVLATQTWACYICRVLPAACAPKPACGKTSADGEACALVMGHPRWQSCRSRKMLAGRAKGEDASTRDGAPKLAGEKTRPSLSIKRNRQGPHYVPR